MDKTPKTKNTKTAQLHPAPSPSEESHHGVYGIARSILRMEEAQDYLMDQFRKARTLELKMKLSNALAANCRALFQGYRAMTGQDGDMTPMERAYNELKELEFDED